jgi:alcohol dehydrogenase
MHDWTDYEFVDVQVIREMTDGAGVDYSFECTGINDVLREAFVSTHDVLRCA